MTWASVPGGRVRATLVTAWVVVGVSCVEPIGNRCGDGLPPCPRGQACIDGTCAAVVGGGAGGGRVTGGGAGGGLAGGAPGGGSSAVDAGMADASVGDGGDVDAGASDGGGVDADAGTDASVPDAGRVDAGLPILDVLARRAERTCARMVECGLIDPQLVPAVCVPKFREYLWSQVPEAARELPLTDAGLACADFDLPCADLLLGLAIPEFDGRCLRPGPRPRALDAGCTADEDCGDPNTVCSAACGRCVTAGRLGERCRPPSQSPRCLSGYCDEQADRCRVFQSLDAGCDHPAACGPDATCRNTCSDGGTCPSRCERLPVAPQPCAPEGCASSSTCIGGVCTLRGAAGAPCTTTEACVSGNSCFRGACRTRGGQGVPCETGDDCTSGTTCDRVFRTCQPQAGGLIGATCTAEFGQCGFIPCTGLFINPDGGVGRAGVCRRAQAGEECLLVDPGCDQGLWCASDGGVATFGVCTPASAGNPCRTNTQCAPTSFCASNQTCQPRAASGAPCDEGRRGSCALENEICMMRGGMARCGPYPSAGQPCAPAPDNRPRCRAPATCDGTLCVDAGLVGLPCTLGLGCIDGACLTSDGGQAILLGVLPESLCFPRQPIGGSCTDQSECQTGLACRGPRDRKTCVGLCQ